MQRLSHPRSVLVAALAAVFALALPAFAGPEDAGGHLTRTEQIAVAGASGGPAYTRRMKLILPAGASWERPVVLFLHGWSASPEDYRLIAEHLASRGFAVALFDQVDRNDLTLTRWIDGAELAIDALEAANQDPGSGVFGELDLDRLGVLGHSYGGQTALGIAGRDGRVDSCVALAPGCGPFLNYRSHADGVRVPLLVVGSERDWVNWTWLWSRRVYERAPALTKMYAEIEDGEHLNYGDTPHSQWGAVSHATQHRLARRYSTAWLERYLDAGGDPGGYTGGAGAWRDYSRGWLNLLWRR